MTRETRINVITMMLAAAIVLTAAWFAGREGPKVQAQGDYPRVNINGANQGVSIPFAASPNGAVSPGEFTNQFSPPGAYGAIAPRAPNSASASSFPIWTTQAGEFVHITTTTATAVKAAAGVVLTINVNTPAAGTVSIFDLASGSCTGTPSTNTVAVITATATAPLGPIQFNAHTINGICVKASVAMDLTAVYQ